jgi:orotate phosphoribosyltransferase
MIYKSATAFKVAEYLLQIKAIKLNPTSPFTWASGWKSPIYCDNRVTLSYIEVRSYIADQLAAAVTEHFGKPNVIAGVATGAIAISALVAQKLNLPMVYVRPKPKEHGLGNQIEGELKTGQSVVVIEDLISTGKSSLLAVDALRNEGSTVLGMCSIFDYGFNVASENFEKANCDLFSLCNYELLIEEALRHKYISPESLDKLKSWRQNPDKWNPNA